jgi:chromosome partitioning protein
MDSLMRTIAIINQKGGCGKTTSAINLSAVLARSGKRVLLVDMDPQGHCAAGLGIPEPRIETDIGDAMLSIGSKPLDPARLLWRAVRNLDLAPSRMKLAGLEASRGGLAELPDKSRRLHMVLEKFSQDYDIAVIDCPPSIGLLTFNALACADMVLIPVETGFFSLQGATRQVQTVKALCRKLGMNIPTWMLPTLHDADSNVATDLLEEVHRRFRDRVVPVIIRRDARLREAASFGQTIVDYAAGSHGAEDYGRLGVWTLSNLQARSPMLESEASIAAEPLPGLDFAEGATGLSEPTKERTPARPADPIEPQVKGVSRAEDVARRAQEFLRRIAMGRSQEASTQTGTTIPSTTIDAVRESAVSSQTVPLRDTAHNVLTMIVDPRKPVSSIPVSPAAHRLLGVSETNQGTLFVQPLSTGRSVAIAGTFNDWSPTAHVLRPNLEVGVHELCLRLPPGKHQYRLVIDGQWSADAYNNAAEPNPFGEVNSVVYTGHAMEQATPGMSLSA